MTLNVGDIVKFSSRYLQDWYRTRNNWYEDYVIGDPKVATFVIKEITSTSYRVIQTGVPTPARLNIFGLSFAKFEKADTLTRHQQILNKIMYLNQRFKERKDAALG